MLTATPARFPLATVAGILSLTMTMAADAAKPSSPGGGGNTTDAARSSCRASALRVDSLPLLGFIEPVVANKQSPDDGDPCVSDGQALLELPANIVNAGVLVAVTSAKPAGSFPAHAESVAVDVGLDISDNILPTSLLAVDVGVLSAAAHVRSVNGQCQLSASSSVSGALVEVAGLTVPLPSPLITDHIEIPVPLVGTLHLNETLTTANKITQRALWLQVTDPVQQLLGLKDVVIGEATADFEGGTRCDEPRKPGDLRRMTGGGKFTDGATTVTHGFSLRCDKASTPQRLQVNWGNGNKFHLDSLSSATCSDAPDVSPGAPAAGFDTYVGAGSGRYNGATGATARWTFTDAGEPGSSDRASIEIKDANGAVVLIVQGSTLFKGNHQAHGSR